MTKKNILFYVFSLSFSLIILSVSSCRKDFSTIPSFGQLEFINGKIYANYWQKPLIAIINPNNGVVEGIVNLTRLVKEMEKSQKLLKEDDVLNGIAFDEKNNRMFVTGKNWKNLFEIELIKKQ